LIGRKRAISPLAALHAHVRKPFASAPRLSLKLVDQSFPMASKAIHRLGSRRQTSLITVILLLQIVLTCKLKNKLDFSIDQRMSDVSMNGIIAIHNDGNISHVRYPVI
jgi:hypothetical protein